MRLKIDRLVTFFEHIMSVFGQSTHMFLWLPRNNCDKQKVFEVLSIEQFL